MLPLFSLPYLPPVSWFALLWPQEQVLLETKDNFQKGSLRNRCYLAGANGVQRLSLPLVKGKHQQQPLREVRLAYDEPWQRQHWRSIRTAYGNAPYWEHYAEALAPFFSRPYPFLIDFNLELLHWLLARLGWAGALRWTEEFISPGAYDPVNDFRNSFPAEPGHWPEWFSPARYPQVFLERTGFLPNLSALDLLFCSGPRAGEILEKSLNRSNFEPITDQR